MKPPKMALRLGSFQKNSPPSKTKEMVGLEMKAFLLNFNFNFKFKYDFQ